MDREYGRIYTQNNYDKNHNIYHGGPNSGCGNRIRNFKNQNTHHDHTYSKFHRFSGNRKYINPRNDEYRSGKNEPGEKRSINQRSHTIKSAYQGSDEHCLAYHSLSEHNSIRKRLPGHVAPEHGSNYRSTKYRKTDPVTTESSSLDKTSSVSHRTNGHKLTRYCTLERHSSSEYPNGLLNQFPTKDDRASCSLMKIYQVIQPRLQQLLLCIFNDKQEYETLEVYAEIHGMASKWQKHFSEEQIKNIRESPDFEGFDSTLIFKCIEVLKDFNPTLIINDSLKKNINETMKIFKTTRNEICHNRVQLSDIQCRDVLYSLKNPLEDLLDIIHTWDKEINITIEKIKVGEQIEKVMTESLSEDEFRYMCLLKVLNYIIESALNKLTQSIFYDKLEKENYKEYFKRKGMDNQTFKDTFFKQEKNILQSNSEDVHPDLTLHCKMIETCKKWHPSLIDNENATKEFTNLLKQIRGIRNHVTHKMLSMSSTNCKTKAKELGDCLEDLINFIQNNKLDEIIGAAKIDIKQIKSDIHFIMSVPYTLP